MREWSCEWEGVPITVQNWTRGLRTGERLAVAGVQVDAHESAIWTLRLSGYLAAPIPLRGTRHFVEAVIGQAQGRVRACCKIFVDGQPVGGDREVALMPPDVARWARTREQGLGRFLVTTGLPRFGFPYAVLAGSIGLVLALAAGRALFPVAIQWVVAGILFGLIMGYLHWRTAEGSFRLRQMKHDQPPRRIG